MTTINSVGLNMSLLSQKQAIVTDPPLSSISNTTELSDSTISHDLVQISSRAQNIQKLNEEFFSHGFQSFTISQSFIDRIEEYSLITAEEASNLSANVISSDSDDEPTDTSTVSELLNFIDDFTKSVKNVAPENTLINILQEAQEVLENFNTPTKRSQNLDISQISGQLQSYIDTYGEQLQEHDKTAFKQLVATLDIAEILTPGSNTTAEINSYLAVTKL